MAKAKKVKTDDAKVVAVLSYVTIIGWIIAFVINSKNKTRLGRFHLRQGLLLAIIGLLFAPMQSMYSLPYSMFFILWVSNAIGLVVLVFCVLGIIYAIQGEETELPIIGPYAQEWFKGL